MSTCLVSLCTGEGVLAVDDGEEDKFDFLPNSEKFRRKCKENPVISEFVKRQKREGEQKTMRRRDQRMKIMQTEKTREETERRKERREKRADEKGRGEKKQTIPPTW